MVFIRHWQRLRSSRCQAVISGNCLSQLSVDPNAEQAFSLRFRTNWTPGPNSSFLATIKTRFSLNGDHTENNDNYYYLNLWIMLVIIILM